MTRQFVLLPLFLTSLILATTPAPALSHGGGLDRFGCHHDRKAGTYHCHQGALAGQVFGSQSDILAFLQQGKAQSTQPPAHAGEFSGKVVGISDGDTIKVMHNGKAERIRLYGIDCPEKGQSYGNKAKQFTSEMIFGKEVTVIDYGKDNKKYKRILGDIILPDGRNLNRELVTAGFAWWYRKYAPHDAILGDLEQEARTAKRGLWADPNPIPPWSWRKQRK